MNNYPTGWRSDIERREWLKETAYHFDMSKPFRAKAVVDPRPFITIENQGNMGSCSGHAMSTCCEVLNYFETRTSVQLSRMFAYLKGQTVDNLLGRDNGATISGVVEAAKRFGICQESTFPYPGRYTTDIPDSAESEASNHKILKHAKFRSYDECYKWLASGTGAMEIGIAWRQSLADNKTGIIEQSSGQTYGGHALAIVGVSDKQDTDGRYYLILVNSHGEQWGSKGTALVAPRLFDFWGSDGNSELIGITDLEEFATRRNWGRIWGK